MLFITLATTLVQIFCKIILDSQFIAKSIIDPDNKISWNTFREELLSMDGLSMYTSHDFNDGRP